MLTLARVLAIAVGQAASFVAVDRAGKLVGSVVNGKTAFSRQYKDKKSTEIGAILLENGAKTIVCCY